MKSKLPTPNGFTMLELLITMVIMATLAALIIVTFPASQKRGRDTNRLSDIKEYQTALENYANNNNGAYPTTANVPANMVNYCGAANLNLAGSLCVDDKTTTQHYRYASNATQYTIWATLEVKSNGGLTQYFITCSNGLSGTLTAAPTNSTCPL